VTLAQRILDVLPQTQCTRCGYPDCAAYAQAIADEQANINQCPPGGAEGVRRLSAVTGHAYVELNPLNGLETPRSVVWIDENWCIGCTLCIEACPVDAIIGTHKRMHTVIEAECTGCELCLPVCPVDCMLLENVSGEASGWDAWSDTLADKAQERYAVRQLRLAALPLAVAPALPKTHKQSRVQAALARAKVQTGNAED
jgi:electron transport complex protein RnfB